MYVLDADILIKAKKTYFQFDRVPPFWSWLAHHAEADNVWMPIETWNKVGDKAPKQRDDLAHWAIDNKDNLVFEDRSYDTRFEEVYTRYKWPDGRKTTEADLETIGDDYALIASALHNNFIVVTNEVRRPKAIGANRKIPNVCDDLNIKYIDLDGSTFGHPGLINLLDFRVDWEG